MFQRKRVTISGSFSRHMKEIGQSMETFQNLDYTVMSPITTNIIKELEDFLYVRGDTLDNIRLTEDKHLNAIFKSDFLWVCCPDGRMGISASLEIGYAIAMNKKIYTKDNILDPTLVEYMSKVNNIDEAIRDYKASKIDWNIKAKLTGLIHLVRIYLKLLIRRLCHA